MSSHLSNLEILSPNMYSVLSDEDMLLARMRQLILACVVAHAFWHRDAF
jgi:hypothetical protein